ncbi:response regulator [Cohnella soli]|uniref:Response regulator n=1 Tax=Cohnella soli TaxID=425005 RepID=A0ABW0I0B3_9BACL
MRNVMIVDDESLVRIGLQSIIDWESNGFRVAGVFKSGEEMLAAAAVSPVDVVLTDIRMPGMDGFQLIRELRKTHADIHVIVLSSYNDFEYTRQAIQLGVTDYISKYEMEPEELLRVLSSLPYEMRKSYDPAQPATPGHTEIGSINDSDKNAMAAKLRDHGSAFRWIVLIPYHRSEAYSPEERKAMRLLAEEMFQRLRNPILFGEEDGIFHGAYAFDPAGDDQRIREECERMAEEWTAAFSQKLNVSLAVGFGDEIGIDGDWTAARKRAEQAAEGSRFDGEVRLSDAALPRGTFSEEEWLAVYKLVKQRIRYMQFTPLAEELLAYQDEKLLSYKPSEWVRLGVAVASQLADFLIERYDLQTAELGRFFVSLWPLPEAAGAVRTSDEWRTLVRELTARTQMTVTSRQSRTGWLERVKEHLSQHFSEAIRLEDMAQLSNFSENHFSQRFRQETGQAFSDYLTDLRVREAVRLFRDTDLSTEEIAFRVGYSNPNYFIKVFKRKTGQTVKHFKSLK